MKNKALQGNCRAQVSWQKKKKKKKLSEDVTKDQSKETSGGRAFLTQETARAKVFILFYYRFFTNYLNSLIR